MRKCDGPSSCEETIGFLLLAFGGGGVGGGLGRGESRRLARLVLTLETCLTELNSLVRVSLSVDEEEEDELDTAGALLLAAGCGLLPLLHKSEHSPELSY